MPKAQRPSVPNLILYCIMSYNEQLKQLEQIVSEIESGQLSIDQLAANVKTATKLIADCRKQLIKVESDINKILKPQE